MNNYIKIKNNLEKLKLNQMKFHFDEYIDKINGGSKSLIDGLYELTNLEIVKREEVAMYSCVRMANFPFLKTMNDLDFSFQPSVNKEQLLNYEYEYLQYLERKENLVFVGTPGVGKTHLATSIGIAADKQRVSVYFISCS